MYVTLEVLYVKVEDDDFDVVDISWAWSVFEWPVVPAE